MTDTTLPPGDGTTDRIEPVDIQHEMQRSYIDYAMSVIVGRALPEVRDGLKPVHPGAVCDVRLGVPAGSRTREIRTLRCRDDG